MALSNLCKLMPVWAKPSSVPRSSTAKLSKKSQTRSHSGFQSSLARTQSRSIYSINKITLLGNVGADPQTTTFADGTTVTNFSLAVSENYTSKKTGEKIDRVDWFRVAVHQERLQEVVQKMIQKGSRVYVEGQLRPRKWTDATGVERMSVEVLVKNKGEVVVVNKPHDGSDSTSQEPL